MSLSLLCVIVWLPFEFVYIANNAMCLFRHKHNQLPYKLMFRVDPLCGDDRVTCWCGCGEAWCAGAKVAKMGFREVRNNGGTASLSAQVLLLVHIVWLSIFGFSILFGLFWFLPSTLFIYFHYSLTENYIFCDAFFPWVIPILERKKKCKFHLSVYLFCGSRYFCRASSLWSWRISTNEIV